LLTKIATSERGKHYRGEIIMADLSSFYQTYSNAGSGVAYLDDNKQAGNSNGIAGRTVIVKVAKTDITEAELDTMRIALQAGGTYSGVTNDAFSIAAVTSDGGDTPGTGNTDFVSGESDVVFFALQGTGNITADASNALGVTGAALTVEAVFNDRDGVDTGLVMAPIA